MRMILAVFAAAAAATGCAGANSGPADGPAWLEDKVRAADAAGGGYPKLSDVPERPDDVPDEAEWRRRVDALDAKRVDVLTNPDLAPTDPRGSSEAFATGAREKAEEGLDAYKDPPTNP